MHTRSREAPSDSEEGEKEEEPVKCSHCSFVAKTNVIKHLRKPSRWRCTECGTTDSVWICLTCGFFGCGRFADGKHSLAHFATTKHPLVMQLETTAVHCYLCDSWVMDEDQSDDVREIRCCKEYVEGAQTEGSLEQSAVMTEHLNILDTILRRWQLRGLVSAFNRWKQATVESREERGGEKRRSSSKRSKVEEKKEIPQKKRGRGRKGEQQQQQVEEKRSDIEVEEVEEEEEDNNNNRGRKREVSEPRRSTRSRSRGVDKMEEDEEGEGEETDQDKRKGNEEEAEQEKKKKKGRANKEGDDNEEDEEEVKRISYRRRSSRAATVASSTAAAAGGGSSGDKNDDEDDDENDDDDDNDDGEECKDHADRANVGLSSSAAAFISTTPTSFGATKKGQTGLRNLGNTCYINSVIQALSNLSYFRDLFLERPPEVVPNEPEQLSERAGLAAVKDALQQRKSLQKQQENNNLSSPFSPVSPYHGAAAAAGGGGSNVYGFPNRSSPFNNSFSIPSLCRVSTLDAFEHIQTKDTILKEDERLLTRELSHLLRVMWSGKWAVVTPHSVISAIWTAVPAFRGYAQQDAQEFLCLLLERLEVENKKAKTLVGTDDDTSGRRKKPAAAAVGRTFSIPLDAKQQEGKNVQNMISELFGGELQVSLTCGHCKKGSSRTEVFSSLSLDMPSERLRQNLQELLTNLEQPETLPESAGWKCDKCHQVASLTKVARIIRFPPLLIIHLKRFLWTASSRKKLEAHVPFPMTGLVLGGGNGGGGGAAAAAAAGGVNYSLQAVICHEGRGYTSGHYISHCRSSLTGNWYKFNDNRVSPILEEKIPSLQAYILFYAADPNSVPRPNHKCGSLAAAAAAKTTDALMNDHHEHDEDDDDDDDDDEKKKEDAGNDEEDEEKRVTRSKRIRLLA